ncbi:MAG TPA: glycosyltransferase [Saprospiraceae bacterium]|nr:glycosyltransferase [Saprospiraceae bacterium]
MTESKKILYVGAISPGQTCYERMKALQALGHEVEGINTSGRLNLLQRVMAKLAHIAGFSPDLPGVCKAMKEQVQSKQFDLIWVDKGTVVQANTLRWIKQQQPGCLLVHLNPDDPFGRFRKGWNVFIKSIPYYDIHFVARTQNVEEFRVSGAKNIYAYDRSFSATLHRPVELSEADTAQYKTPVGFVGTYAPERAAMIAHLIRNGVPVAVYGDGWTQGKYWDIIRPHYRGAAQYGEGYVKIINGMDIALHFLRHENRDEQDSRTFEIPACGTFMIAERSRKHEAFFRENEEAVFFDTAEELLEKVRRYLVHPEETKRIAAAGRRRCIESGYDHNSRMKELFERVELIGQIVKEQV